MCLRGSIPDSEALSRMTAPAILEIQIAAERSLAIMTSRAGVVAAGEVFKCPGRADLALLWQSGSVVVTIGAPDPLARTVLGVTEANAERTRVGGSSAVTFLIVTDIARGKVSSIGLRVRSVAGVALVMRRQVGRNRQSHTAP